MTRLHVLAFVLFDLEEICWEHCVRQVLATDCCYCSNYVGWTCQVLFLLLTGCSQVVPLHIVTCFAETIILLLSVVLLHLLLS